MFYYKFVALLKKFFSSSGVRSLLLPLCTSKFFQENVIVSTPLVGEELYTQMGSFGRSMYSSWRNVSAIIKYLVQRRIRN